MMPKKQSNPLLDTNTGFSLADSFGPQPAFLVPSPSGAGANAGVSGSRPSGFLGADEAPPAVGPPTVSPRPSPTPTPPTSLSRVSSTSSMTNQQLQPPAAAATIQQQSLGPPPPGVFLLPSASSPSTSAGLPPPPSPSTSSSSSRFTLTGAARKSRYVAPPGINSSPAPASNVQRPVQLGNLTPAVAQFDPQQQQLLPDAGSGYHMGQQQFSGANTYFGEGGPGASVTDSSGFQSPRQATVDEVAHHWFYKVTTNSFMTVGLGGIGASSSPKEQWKPFTMIDSVAIEDVFLMDPNSNEPIPTDGGRYDVCISDRTKTAVYWAAEEEPLEIRRCSWFYKSNVDARWTPYTEDVARRLEHEYASAVLSGQWNRKLDLSPGHQRDSEGAVPDGVGSSSPTVGNGEHIMLHSPTVMMHFPSSGSGHVGLGGNLDDWGQVQPHDPELKPRVVHRGLEGLPEIPDGEVPEVDHLVFVVHGIGSACDIKFRKITEVVSGYRNLTADLSERHFQSAHLSGRANRIEFLPVNWHTTLHGRDFGTDSRIRPHTLRSIPKLRSFVNDTLLDVLFYTSPIFCQTILDTVVSEINRMYTLFMSRNESFSGQVSLMGHSLGSVILFDVLSNQSGESPTYSSRQSHNNSAATLLPTQQGVQEAFGDFSEKSLEQVFTRLGLTSHISTFTNEGIDLEIIMASSCLDEDLKEAGLPEDARKKLLEYVKARKEGKSGQEQDLLDQYKKDTVTSDIKYVVGPAGTGQPSVSYPSLCFQPACFYALGSPIGMFQAVRGIQSLGKDFRFPTCPKFYNIFHPYDPVAYRVESLLDAAYEELRPVVVPHHKGRKRMHLELKDTVTKLMTSDLKQKIIDSVSATLTSFYNIATGSGGNNVETALEESMTSRAALEEEEDAANPRKLDAMLNNGARVDHVLQEAPLESFNEYLFALASHLCYWESEDTCLMVLKDIMASRGVSADDEVAGVPYLNTTTVPPTLEQPTPILAPPVHVPIGGAMKGPPVPQTSPTPTAILAPPVYVPVGGAMKGAPVPQAMPPTLSLPQQASAGGAIAPPPAPASASSPTTFEPSHVPSPTGVSASNIPLNSTVIAASGNDNIVSPAMFGPSGLGPSPIPSESSISTGTSTTVLGPPPVLPGVTNSGGRISAYPKVPQSPTGMGMDPTAPVASGKSLGPPPTGGFYQRK